MVDLLPSINACLNSLAAICIMAGWRAIRQKRISDHKKWMITAFIMSCLFLAGYLTRHALAGSTAFQGQGIWRTIYFSILIPHTILAIVNLPLIITSMILGLSNKIDRHRKLARITLPIWLFVSTTGVIIYFMLYHFFT